MLQHLYTSKVDVLRMKRQLVNGIMQITEWETVVEGMPCRIDLLYRDVRLQQFIVAESGKLPDRVGIVYFEEGNVRAADRLDVTNGPNAGLLFELEDAPEIASGFAEHHYEVYVREIHSG